MLHEFHFAICKGSASQAQNPLQRLPIDVTTSYMTSQNNSSLTEFHKAYTLYVCTALLQSLDINRMSKFSSHATNCIICQWLNFTFRSPLFLCVSTKTFHDYFHEILYTNLFQSLNTAFICYSFFLEGYKCISYHCLVFIHVSFSFT